MRQILTISSDIRIFHGLNSRKEITPAVTYLALEYRKSIPGCQ